MILLDLRSVPRHRAAPGARWLHFGDLPWSVFFFQHLFWKGDLQNETIANREKDWHFHNFHNLDLLAKICPGGFSSSTQTNAWEIVEKQGSEIIDTS